MNKKALGIGSAVAAGSAFAIIASFIFEAKKDSKDIIKEDQSSKLLASLPESDKAILDEEKELSERYRDICNREAADIKSERHDLNVELAGKKAEIQSKIDSELQSYKEAMNYTKAKKDIQDEFDKGVDSFKRSIRYDQKTKDLQNNIDSAQSALEKKTAYLKRTAEGDADLEDYSEAMIEAAKEDTKTQIGKLKDQINALDDKVEDRKSELREVMNRSNDDLDQKVSDKRVEIAKRYEGDLNSLNGEYRQKYAEAEHKVKENRSAEDQATVDRYYKVDQQATDICNRIEHEATQFADTTDTEHRIAYALASTSVSGTLLGVLGAIPAAFGVVGSIYGYYRLLRLCGAVNAFRREMK